MNRSRLSTMNETTASFDRLIDTAIKQYDPLPLPAEFAAETAAMVTQRERADRQEWWLLLGSVLIAIVFAVWFDKTWINELGVIQAALAPFGGGQSWVLAAMSLGTAWAVDQWLARRGNSNPV
ncbi:MAG: hypothetical protein R3F04_02790 [Lysobacteraceae bacterium]